MLEKDIEKVLIDEKEIENICARLGREIEKDYAGKKPVFIGILNGCLPFMSDLLKHIDLYLEVEYLKVSSYHGTSSGEVKIIKDLDRTIKGRDVILVEDIVDTGNTLTHLMELFSVKGAKTINVVTLLDKPSARIYDFTPKYIGQEIPKEFVVGYGLDYNEEYRNLPYIGLLKKEVYTK